MEIDLKNMPQMNMNFAHDYINDMFNQTQREQERTIKMISDAAEERRKKFDETRQAAIEPAENTAEIKGDMTQVIHNQNNYIKILEHQNEVLKNIFASGEDGVAIQKEILKILQDQGELDGTFKDKGLDAAIQTVFLGIQMWLKSKGIDF